MLWPADHPALCDPALAPYAAGVSEVCPEGRARVVLRYLEQRRVATLVDTPTGPLVVKVFASPRARGNVRRLRCLAASKAFTLVPPPGRSDRSGHVGSVPYMPGRGLGEVDEHELVDLAAPVGDLLRRLHTSGAELDRTWTSGDEVRSLVATATPTTNCRIARLADTLDNGRALSDAPLVPSHRDCHPKQVVVSADGRLRLIDLDDAAMAPAGLDLGNFAAHLVQLAITGERSEAACRAAVREMIDGYGPGAGDVQLWTALSLLRLASLAETRMRRPALAHALVEQLPAVLDRRWA